MSNSLRLIKPRKQDGVWVFDDEAAGLTREPFVPSFGAIIDAWLDEVGVAGENGFNLFFSDSPFPDCTIKLDRMDEMVVGVGTWYGVERYSMHGWLCPALFKYFPSAPVALYGMAVKL